MFETEIFHHYLYTNRSHVLLVLQNWEIKQTIGLPPVCSRCRQRSNCQISLRASYMYTYSLLTGGTFEIFISLHQLCTQPNDADTVRNISELLLWNSFQLRRYVFLDVFNILKSWSL